MKNIILVLLLAMMAGCNEEIDLGPNVILAKSLPFENSDLRLEEVSFNHDIDFPKDMHFFDEKTGVVVAEGRIFKTTNGGRSWALKFSNETKDQPFHQILFVDQNTGYVVGGANWCHGTDCVPPGALVLKTIDGGETWEKIYEVSGLVEFRVIAVNSAGALFLMKNNQILKSVDDGAHWAHVASLDMRPSKMVFDGNYGYCVGRDNEGNGVVVKSHDNGDTWAQTTKLTASWISDISFAENVGYSLEYYGSVFQTTNDGNHWKEVKNTKYSQYILSPLTSTSCLIWGEGYYTGGCFGYNYGAVWQTIDGGNTWKEIQFEKGLDIRCASFYTSNQGYAMDLYGRLIKVTVKRRVSGRGL